MKKIYLDNASTSFPKAPGVASAVSEFIEHAGVNINRGSYQAAGEAEDIVYETRSLVSGFFGSTRIKNLVFTQNVTTSLNMILKGLLKPGDHVLVSSMEHNAVMRPLVQMEKQGISFDRIPCDREGMLILSGMEKLLRPETRAVVMTLASNVCGTVMPFREVGAFCRRHGILFVADTAQAAGTIDINMEEACIDALAFTGHKGFLGPQGIGGFILSEELVGQIEPLISGGTGSISHTEEVPGFMPDRFEPGTMNLPGICGLYAGAAFVRERGTEQILRHELELTGAFLEGLAPLEENGRLRIAGRHALTQRTGVVSVYTDAADMGEAAFRLDEEYGIMIRSGLHCAPNAHKTLGTFPQGTLRFSFGWNNTAEDVEAAVRALYEITA